MPSFARTYTLVLFSAGAFIACGHLAFDPMPLGEGTGTGEDSGLVDGSGVDGGRDADRLDSGLDAADGGCEGPTCVGTFVSGATGSDSNPGTADKPVQTIKKAIGIAVALGGKQSVYVAAHPYSEKITLAEGVDLLAGYDCSALPCTWARDINKHDTVILNQDHEGVVAPKTVTRATVFDGFRVVGKGGTPTLPSGSAAMSLVGGTPTITRCQLAGGEVSGGGVNARSIGVAVLGPSNDPGGALIDQNMITGGTSTDQSIGVLFDTKPGGGAGSTAVAVVTSNTIQSGTAPFTSGVLAWTSGAGTLLKNNVIAGGTSANTSGNNSQSWGITVGSVMTIDANRINTNTSAVCTVSANGNFCGGIQSLASTTTIINNVVFGAKAPKACAVLLSDGESSIGSVILNGNTLDGSGSGDAGVLSTAVAVRIRQGVSAQIGSVRNNILLGGLNKYRYGVYEEAGSGKTARPVVLTNNDFWHAGAPRSDFAYRVWNGNAGTDLPFAQIGTLVAPTPSDNLNVDPLLDTTHHLSSTSPLIDKGTTVEASSHDIDGENRPKGGGIDIGADEAK